MRFDTAAPGGGMVVYTKVENGKCLLELQFFYDGEKSHYNGDLHPFIVEDMKYFVGINIVDEKGVSVFECIYPVDEEETAKGLLLHPHLWNGLENPYLYKIRARLICREDEAKAYPVDELTQILPLRSLQHIAQKGWYLNGKPFEIRAVRYFAPSKITNGVPGLEQAKTDLELLRQMGANTICLEDRVLDEEIIALCEEMGFVVWCGAQCRKMSYDIQKDMGAEKELVPNGMNKEKKFFKSDLPRFAGEVDGGEKVLAEGELHLPTDFYFYYKACWSREPFVHIVTKSLKRQENGNYSLTVYSNQKRVALYVDGVLFEFRVGAPEYVFEEIPGKKIPLLITVEAGECRKSMSFYLRDQ